MGIADDMVKYRAKNRMSQTELAKKCGVSLQTICSIETGQQNPSRMTVEKIKLVIEQEEE